MKKILCTLIVFSFIAISFFYYEGYTFDQYIANPAKTASMNIPINQTAPVKAGSQIEINAPLSTVWETHTNISNWPSWQKDITKAVVHGNIQEGTGFDWKACRVLSRNCFAVIFRKTSLQV